MRPTLSEHSKAGHKRHSAHNPTKERGRRTLQVAASFSRPPLHKNAKVGVPTVKKVVNAFGHGSFHARQEGAGKAKMAPLPHEQGLKYELAR